jgi:hypothetical protein
LNSQYNIKKNLQWYHYISTKLYIYSIVWVNMKTGIWKYIGLVTLAGVSLTCDSNTKNLSSTIKDQKSDIENVFIPPVDSNNTTIWWTRKHISENTSPKIIDTLIQWDISHQQDITNKDTMNSNIMKIVNISPNNHTTDTMQRWLHNNTVISEISTKENIKKTLSKEECKDMCDKQITKAIIEIVPETEKIKFNLSYMRWEASSLFTHFFTIEDRENWVHIIFSKIQENDKSFVINHMDNMKNHIKNQKENSWKIKRFLWKWHLRDYIINGSKEPEKGEKSNIEKIYEIITNQWTITYKWGLLQFQKDVESVINLYQ